MLKVLGGTDVGELGYVEGIGTVDGDEARRTVTEVVVDFAKADFTVGTR